MTKKEYLDSLREFMSYELPSRLVEKNIAFYDSYFEEQLKTGKTFQEIEEELGDPQLIARSCIDAARSGADGIPNSEDDVNFAEEIEREKESRSNFSGQSASNGQAENGKSKVHLISGAGCLIPILIFVFIAFLLISFFSTPFGMTVLIGLIVAGVVSALIRAFRR